MFSYKIPGERCYVACIWWVVVTHWQCWSNCS